MTKIAVMGYGTIGSGVVEVLSLNKDRIKKTAGDEITVKYVLDVKDCKGTPAEDLVVHDIGVILEDPEVSIVVETMGGVKFAYPFVKQCLEAGKSVCTSNKELVEKYGPELISLAKEKGIQFLFEASCGGGIPVIRALLTAYTADEIEEISGILNGTTNFILTKMLQEGADYEEVLREAQEMGIAERNPEADVEGHDPCRKIAILSSLVYGKNVNFEDIYTEGITGVTDKDMAYVKELGSAVKLIASFIHREDKYYAMVSPFVVSSHNPLYNVNGAYNAIFIHGNAVGDTMLYGSGAGMMQTASAVVADVISAARGTGETKLIQWSDEKLIVDGIGSDRRCFLVRVSEDRLEKAKELFDSPEVIRVPGIEGEAALVTAVMSEDDFKKKADEIGIISRLRIK